jgi:FKBP-type peptidyl-prolyl cis-trans isomerase FklB
MRYLAALILSIFLLFGVCSAQGKPELKDQKDKESYSLGYQFGQYLKLQGVDINLDVYTSAIKDALGNKEPSMSKDEIIATIRGLEQRVQAARQKALKEKGAKNLEEGKAFLAENQKKKDVKTLPSGLQYKVLKEGSGKTPKATDTVSVNYKGTLLDGTEFDSSYKRGQPISFKVGEVIKGWSEALQHMKEGSKYQLFIPPDLAYGERAIGQTIAPNSTLIFEVDLIKVEETK